MSRKQILRYALVKATPILCSYLFVSMAYGILMAEAGFPWFDALLVSLTVYTRRCGCSDRRGKLQMEA